MPAGCGRLAHREVGLRSYTFAPATTIGPFARRPGPACTVPAHSHCTDHPDRSRRAESLHPTSGHGVRRRALTAAAVRHDHCVWRLDGIGRSQPSRPAGLPVHELRGEGSDRGDSRGPRSVTVGSASPALAVSGPSWQQLLIVRGSGRVRTGSAQFRRPTRRAGGGLAAADAVQPPTATILRYTLTKTALASRIGPPEGGPPKSRAA